VIERPHQLGGKSMRVKIQCSILKPLNPCPVCGGETALAEIEPHPLHVNFEIHGYLCERCGPIKSLVVLKNTRRRSAKARSQFKLRHYRKAQRGYPALGDLRLFFHDLLDDQVFLFSSAVISVRIFSIAVMFAAIQLNSAGTIVCKSNGAREASGTIINIITFSNEQF
jgi:hypothetical protein